MSRRLLTLPLCLAAFGAVPTVADAASTTRYPTVTKITPLRAGIGETMTITGRNFVRGQRKNTVVFKRDGKPAVFVKVDNATPTRLTILLPEKLRGFLASRSGARVPTKFRIRILARRFSRGYTSLASSPTIVPTTAAAGATPVADDGRTGTGTTATGGTTVAAAVAAGPGSTGGGGDGGDAGPAPEGDCDLDGIKDLSDSDDDGDLLEDTLEVALNTNRCAKDTDGDGMEDGWEYKSAFDLNRESCPAAEYPTPCEPATPFPGKRPYPNPLDPSDRDLDYDGDALPAWAEHQASLRHGRTVNQLWYSDGLKASIDTSASPNCRGMVVPPALSNEPHYSLDVTGDGCLNDAERDEDNDFLSNFTELRGSMQPGSWKRDYKEPLYALNYQGTDWLDQDSDGDTRVDGIDDQDNDDFWNVEEVYRGPQSVNKIDEDSGSRRGLWVDAFNPCLPSPESRTCSNWVSPGTEIYRPFVAVDSTRDEWPKPRWPLYGTAFYNGEAENVTTPEIWNGIPSGSQTLPPAHPLVPRPGF